MDALESERVVMRQLSLWDNGDYLSWELRNSIVRYVNQPGSVEFDQLILADAHIVKRTVFATISERGQSLIAFLTAFTGESWFDIADEVSMCAGSNAFTIEKSMLYAERHAPKIHQAHYALGTVAEHVKRTENQESP